MTGPMAKEDNMPLVTTTEMFKKAYEGGYAVGAFNVNNMEIVQGIVDAAKEEQSPLILQVSAGARKYAKHIYLVKLVEAALEDSNLPIALHLDHGDSFANFFQTVKVKVRVAFKFVSTVASTNSNC